LGLGGERQRSIHGTTANVLQEQAIRAAAARRAPLAKRQPISAPILKLHLPGGN
jgi:hypothetical protein